ncbi:DUF397 domain-containing protein [Streptomyces sp. NBRC 110465]|uniref:DUF397 domain-containing protein n=1 Tax=Streptomyces sp. NBRC 110465 TaxID=1897621 RepID=UPI000AEAAD0D|nr:DUF397 domain-containing protein [Streptomyces sp. NBRC 110465]
MTTNNLTPPELRGAVWRKSSYSGGNEGQCVEVADLTAAPSARQRGVRDSKNPEGPALLVRAATFTAFMAGLKAGALDI